MVVVELGAGGRGGYGDRDAIRDGGYSTGGGRDGGYDDRAPEATPYDGQGDGGPQYGDYGRHGGYKAVEVEEGMVATLEEGMAVRRTMSRMTMTRTWRL